MEYPHGRDRNIVFISIANKRYYYYSVKWQRKKQDYE